MEGGRLEKILKIHFLLVVRYLKKSAIVFLEHENWRKNGTDEAKENILRQSGGPNIACCTAKSPASKLARIISNGLSRCATFFEILPVCVGRGYNLGNHEELRVGNDFALDRYFMLNL